MPDTWFSSLPKELQNVIGSEVNAQMGVITGMLSYCSGVHYVYSVKQMNLKKIRSLPYQGCWVALVMSATAVSSTYFMNRQVTDPLNRWELICEPCAMLRGVGVGLGTTWIGLVGVTSLQSYNYVSKTSLHHILKNSHQVLANNIFGTTCMVIAFVVGLALASKQYKATYEIPDD